MAGWNQGNQGGGGNFVIEDASNNFAAMEAMTEGTFGAAVRGIARSDSGYGVWGSIPVTAAATGFGGVFQGGLAYIDGLYNLSDARIKKDINPIGGALSKIMNINGVSFKYDYSKYSTQPRINENTYYGFIAQNVKQQLPHAVKEKLIPVDKNKPRSGDTEKELLNVVDYTAVIPVLVEAMKEQQAQIQELSEQIETLKQE